MAWTYSLSDLATSEKDQIRLEIGDVVNRTDGLTLADEEITQAIAVEDNFWGAAARCAELLSTRFLLKADVRLGRSLMVAYTKTAEQLVAKAKMLRSKNLAAAPIYVGGMKVSDKQAYQQDQTLVQPMFARDMQESPRAGTQTSEAVTDSSVGGDPDTDFD